MLSGRAQNSAVTSNSSSAHADTLDMGMCRCAIAYYIKVPCSAREDPSSTRSVLVSYPSTGRLAVLPNYMLVA